MLAATGTDSTRMLVDVTRMSISKGYERPDLSMSPDLLANPASDHIAAQRAIMPFKFEKYTEIHFFCF